MAHGAQASTVRLGGVPSGCEGSCNGQGRKGSTESDRGRSAREGKPPLGRWEVLYATANQPLLVMMESKLQPVYHAMLPKEDFSSLEEKGKDGTVVHNKCYDESGGVKTDDFKNVKATAGYTVPDYPKGYDKKNKDLKTNNSVAAFAMSWLRDFRSFAGETSAHGVKNIFEGPNKLMKLLFLVVWLSASIYTCYIIVTSVVTFINKPTGTKYEVIVSQDGSDIANSPRPQTIKFPTISVCSHNKVKKSYLELPENAKVKKVWEIIDQYQVKKTKDLDWEGELADLKNMTYEDIIDAGGPASNRLLSCTQRLKNCNSEELLGKNYMLMESTSTGKCWRINPEGKLFGKGGDWGKLQLMFWADLKDYGERTADGPAYGFTVALHDHETYGSTIASGYFMSPGSMYKVDVSLKREKREPPPGGICDVSKTNTSYGAFDEGACVYECKDRYLYEQCGCVNVRPPLQHPSVPNYRSCSLQEWADCGLKAYTDWTSRYMDPNYTEDSCYCPSACQETRYESKLSSSSISPAYARKLLQDKRVQGYLKSVASNPKMNISYSTPEDILENMMVVELLFTSMSVSEIRQVVTYTFYNMLGDIGGVLGLFLGASLFTILEFFQFLLFAVGKHCLGWKTGDDHEKLQDQEMPAMKDGEREEYKS